MLDDLARQLRQEERVERRLRAETAPIGVARQGPLTCPLATFAVAICNSSFTSTPVVRLLGKNVARRVELTRPKLLSGTVGPGASCALLLSPVNSALLA